MDALIHCELLCLDLPKGEALRGELKRIDFDVPALAARALCKDGCCE